MIKVRVDWHSQCPGCGTQLAVDFLEDSPDRAICPWCGCLYEIECEPGHEQVKQYVRVAISELETKANTMALA